MAGGGIGSFGQSDDFIFVTVLCVGGGEAKNPPIGKGGDRADIIAVHVGINPGKKLFVGFGFQAVSEKAGAGVVIEVVVSRAGIKVPGVVRGDGALSEALGGHVYGFYKVAGGSLVIGHDGHAAVRQGYHAVNPAAVGPDLKERRAVAVENGNVPFAVCDIEIALAVHGEVPHIIVFAVLLQEAEVDGGQLRAGQIQLADEVLLLAVAIIIPFILGGFVKTVRQVEGVGVEVLIDPDIAGRVHRHAVDVGVALHAFGNFGLGIGRQLLHVRAVLFYRDQGGPVCIIFICLHDGIAVAAGFPRGIGFRLRAVLDIGDHVQPPIVPAAALDIVYAGLRAHRRIIGHIDVFGRLHAAVAGRTVGLPAAGAQAPKSQNERQYGCRRPFEIFHFIVPPRLLASSVPSELIQTRYHCSVKKSMKFAHGHFNVRYDGGRAHMFRSPGQ